MAITFHCSHCSKKIEAQDSAAGKWGKCPSCHNKVYVPDIHADANLKLAPIDEQEEAKRKQLMAESYKLSQDILRERENANGASSTVSASQISDKELTKNILNTGYAYRIPELRHKKRMQRGLPKLPKANIADINKLFDLLGISNITNKEKQ